MSFFDAVSNVIGGGAVGALGSAFTRWHKGRLELDALKVNTSHELALGELELRQLELTSKMEVDKAAYATLTESFGADSANYSTNGQNSLIMLVVDAVRGLIRPLLTMLLVVCTSYLGVTLGTDTYVDPSVKAELLTQIITGLVGCTSMALAWWFGARGIK